MAVLSTPDFNPILTDTGNGPSFTMFGTTMRLIATAADTGRKHLQCFRQVTPTGWGPPRHTHSREDRDYFYILEGTYELHVGDERRSVFRWRLRRSFHAIAFAHGFRNVAPCAEPITAMCHHSRWTRGVFLSRVAKCPPLPPIPHTTG